MKRTLAFAFASLAATAAFAEDVDFYPNGFVSAVIREAKSDQQRIVAQAEKTRAQVRAETSEAARLGLLNTSEAGGKQPTAEQARQVEREGLRAVAIKSTSK